MPHGRRVRHRCDSKRSRAVLSSLFAESALHVHTESSQHFDDREVLMSTPIDSTSSSPDECAIEAVVVGPAEPEIVALETRLRAAQIASDVGVLNELIADDLLFTGSDGALATKAQDLAAHGSGIVRFRTHTHRELRTRRIGNNVVVVSLPAQLGVEIGSSLQQGAFRCTRVWATESGGSWRVVAGHVSVVQTTPSGDLA